MKSLSGDRWTYTASGLATVLAARIGALSGETRLYVGPGTYRYIESAFDCECIGVPELKNMQEPVPVYWVKGHAEQTAVSISKTQEIGH